MNARSHFEDIQMSRINKKTLDRLFPRYLDFNPLVPVWCVTHESVGCIHRFFDSSPFSPSGRYLALFRLPQEQRLPQPGEVGHILLVDLETGNQNVIAETRGWETQLGANVQWGENDQTLLFNDVDTANWEPRCVVLNPFTGERRSIGRGIYRVSPDGRQVLCANLTTMRRTQNGYGIVIPDEKVPRNLGLSEEDGLYMTDISTSESRLLVSITKCVRSAVPRSEFNDLEQFEFYGFHCKWNPKGTRLLFSIRGYPPGPDARFDIIDEGIKYEVYTLDAKAERIHLAVPAHQWDKGGHHINWYPDGDSLSMNLDIDGDGLRLVTARYDGSGLQKILPRTLGSGHPTVHPNGRHILTDSYPWEPVSFGDGTVPIRLIDRISGKEATLVRIKTQTEQQVSCSALRVDAHPAWDFNHRMIAFNGFAGGTRRVYVADLRELTYL